MSVENKRFTGFVPICETFSSGPCWLSMRSRVYPCILLLAVLWIGCEDRIPIATGPGGGADISSYLRPMTHARVEFRATTLLHVYSKQGSLDPGSNQDQWAERLYDFENYDSSYSIDWQDSVFSMRSCYRVVNLSTGGIEDTRCSGQSLIRGSCGQSNQEIHDLTCFVSDLEGASPGQLPDDNNYRQSYTNLSVPTMTLETVYDDSVSFIVNDESQWQRVGFSYADDERWYGTYITKLHVPQWDTLGVQTKPTCRIVFYDPK